MTAAVRTPTIFRQMSSLTILGVGWAMRRAWLVENTGRSHEATALAPICAAMDGS